MKKKLLTIILTLALSANFAIQANAETAGWYNNNGTWYYYYSDGSMVTGWVQSSGKWYYMLNDGSMAVNTKVNSYYLDNDGAWSTNAPSTVYNGANIKTKLYGLGFVDKNGGLTLNPYGASGGANFAQMGFTVGSGDRDMTLNIYQSNSDVDKKVKTILNWILPTQGDYLYSVLDTNGLKSQTLELDGRTVNIRVQSYGIAIDFSPMS
ncbi:hypothetical protein [Clostridium beijerinckii]|uniref:hypothetical protein n=1 Tax=Clostridium beijerinckii TaxID=1520 RepID=UPI001360BAAF|nr:hypothetical protein [Clostridium beijerinckii]MZK49038.1 hypothetical protein [Clostridium beijerinckii]MZK57413.1 hypothetical protein [Clostridium beijerinckii]MZK67624.1 hypothetical protein [Clostridium beijerinckii]MZK72709.1 hypothetical protein [Clostridium beijerinckii]MZK82305.1 hypothetical protein [Clostridium beijerinckii]